MTSRGGPFGDPRMFKAFFFGPGGPGHHHRGGRGGPRSRARRGDVRAALLLLIEEHAQNGYQLIQEIERRTDGVWKPSPGSVYPALQQLEDEGLVRTVEFEGKRTSSSRPKGASTSNRTARNSATRSAPLPAAWTRTSWTCAG